MKIDKWLNFGSLEVANAFRDTTSVSNSSHSSGVLKSVLGAQALYFLFELIQILIRVSPEHFEYHSYMIIMTLVFSLLEGLLLVLEKCILFLKIYKSQIGRWLLALNLIGVYEIYLAFGDHRVYPSPLDCGVVYLEIILAGGILLLVRRWQVKCFSTFACSSYILLRKSHAYPVSLRMSNVIICIMITVAFSCAFYWFEKQKKEAFLRNYGVTNQEKILKNLLSGLPEGIMIMDKNEKPIYYNDAMYAVLSCDNDQEAILEKIQELHLNDIFKEIESANEKGYFDESAQAQGGPYQFTLNGNRSPRRTHQEIDSPVLEPMMKKRSKLKESPTNKKSLKYLSVKTSLSLSQQECLDSFRNRANNSTLPSPTKKSSEQHSRLRLREESFHSQDQATTPPKGRIWKRLSSSLYPMEGLFRKEFDEEKLKGYAANPAIAQDYILFNFHGEYFKNGRDCLVGVDQSSQRFAYEVKMREMDMEDQKYKVLIITDISIREQLASLETNNKYKTLMFASLSHELRTPLNGIYSMLEVAIKQIQDTNIIQNYLKPALISAQMLKFLISDMLDYSKILTQKLVLSLNSFYLKECLQEVVEIIEPQLKIKNLSLNLNIAANVPRRLCSDKTRIQQVLINLLSNAVKFTTQGGVTISVAVDASRVNVVQISVQDTGVGLLETDKLRLEKLLCQFDATERVSQSSSGVGMGLMMSQSIALALGVPKDEEDSGISIESEFGKGSEFTFTVYNHNVPGTLEEMITIPSLPEERSPESRMSHFVKPNFDLKIGINKHAQKNEVGASRTFCWKVIEANCSCKKVLIVDDTAYNVMALQAQLNALGVESDATYNGEEAIKKVCEENENRENCCQGYSLVFMDFNMPILDGYEATRKIKLKIARKEIKPITIIGCTAYTDKHLLDQGLRSGMDGYITKPVTSKVLKKILEENGLYTLNESP